MTCNLKPYLEPDRIEAGCDEAGRGCLAGPVHAAAVILPKSFNHPLLDDSKKLNKKKRDLLREIIEKEAIAWCVAKVDQQVIDEINILNASIMAMHLAVDGLILKLDKEDHKISQPDFLLIDGHRFKPYHNIPHSCEIKGDGRFMSIAAASVLAKTHRDEFMEKLNIACPGYGWNKNAGYPTKEHRAGIREHGVTEYHRRTFRLLDEQMEIPF